MTTAPIKPDATVGAVSEDPLYPIHPDLVELAQARQELAIWQERVENCMSNNPDKHRLNLTQAKIKVIVLVEKLKAKGLIPYTEQDLLEIELDRLFPNAKEKAVVQYQGQSYIRRITVLQRTRSRKNVVAWNTSWELFEKPF